MLASASSRQLESEKTDLGNPKCQQNLGLRLNFLLIFHRSLSKQPCLGFGGGAQCVAAETHGKWKVLQSPFGQYLFADITEVQDTATEWLWTYNHERPNTALGGITPAHKLKRQMEANHAA